MSSKKERRKGKEKKDGKGTLKLIKEIVESNTISAKEIESFSSIDFPLFSFKYFKDYSINKCKNPAFFLSFLKRLQKLWELGWSEIRSSHRHSCGMEHIPVEQIIPRQQLPTFVTKEVDLDVFRATGDNHVFVGLQEGKVFHIFFIEANFGDVYSHS